MSRSCLEGYLTDKCKECPFWSDGSDNRGIGCNIPAPIMNCPSFAKMYDEENGTNYSERMN